MHSIWQVNPIGKPTAQIIETMHVNLTGVIGGRTDAAVASAFKTFIDSVPRLAHSDRRRFLPVPIRGSLLGFNATRGRHRVTGGR